MVILGGSCRLGLIINRIFSTNLFGWIRDFMGNCHSYDVCVHKFYVSTTVLLRTHLHLQHCAEDKSSTELRFGVERGKMAMKMCFNMIDGVDAAAASLNHRKSGISHLKNGRY